MSSEWIVKIVSNNWPMFIRGAGTTLYISIISTILGTIIGLLVGGLYVLFQGHRGQLKELFLKLLILFFPYI